MQSKAFTKLFASITDSSIWSEDDATRIIWITMLAMADCHGYVGASIPGLAARSRKSIAEVETALQKFRSPDPYSRTRDYDGRRITDVDGGWMLLNYEKHREVARTEAAKDSKRRWAATARAKARESTDVDASRTEVDASRDQLSTVDISSNCASASASEISVCDQDPDLPYMLGIRAGARAVKEASSVPVDADGSPPVFHTLDGWDMSAELRAEAVIDGVPPEDIDKRVKELRNGPIGGRRGVIDRDEYVRSQFPKWRTWGEADRAKAISDAAKGPRSAFGSTRDHRGGPLLEASESHRRYAAKHGIDVDAVVSHLNRKGVVDAVGIGRAREMLAEELTRRAKAKARATA